MKKIITAAVLLIVTMAMTVTSFAAANITRKEAINIALKDAGTTRAKVYGLEAEKEHGKFEIEFTKKSNKTVFEYEISKKGRVLEKSVDIKYKKDHSKEKVGKEAARKAVAKHAGVSYKTVKKGTCKYEYDDDDREGTYEVKFRNGSYKYDYEVLAPTGKIIEYSKKYRK